MTAPPVSDARLLAAIALISAAATTQQIALMQVLGWMHWHPFAYMIVAIALLGFGIAGTVLSLARTRLLAAWRPLLPWLLLCAALSTPLGVRLAQADALAVDLPLLFFAPLHVWRLVALCLLLLPPFFCAGLATGLALTVHARQPGRLYAASLAGAGLGGLLGLALAAHISPPRLPVLVSVLPLVAVACVSPRLDARVRAGRLVTLALIGALAVGPWELRPSQFKPIRRVLDLPDARIHAARPSIHGWCQIVDAPALRPAPAVSLQFQGEIPSQRAVFVNGLAYGSLPDSGALAAPAWLDHTTDAAAFAVLKPPRVLLLENGPGGWSALARRHGATRIDIVEPDHVLVDLLTTGERPLAPEWLLPGTNVRVASGRAHVRRAVDAVDLIRFPTIGALGGTAGLGAASEQFLFTREAFDEAWQRLAPGGTIAVTAWMEFPERNPLRLLATLAEALAAAGAPPRAHLVAVRGWATVTFLARRPADPATAPWRPPELAALRAFCTARGFDPLLLPDLAPAERAAHHAWQNPAFFELVDALVDGPREPVYRNYEFVLRPATDDRPYFSQFLRPAAWRRITDAFDARAMPFFELGSFIVALTFVILAALGIVGIALPLLRHGWRAPGKAAVLLYFGGLGAGFMLVEIGLILRAHAWLGAPVSAAAVVITVLLLASGAGSLWSERWPAAPASPRRAATAIALVTLTGGLALAALSRFAPAWPAPAAYTALVAVVACIGVPLGTAFPIGLRQLEAAAPAHVPWAWAINGCVSVATPAGAMLLAMQAGFSALFLAAAAAYTLAFLGTLLSGASTTRSS